jgi:hypothetical protein
MTKNHEYMEDEFKTVAKFSDPMSAHITAGMLRENGIPAEVFGENSSYTSLNYVNPVEVKVVASDYEAALSLIAAADKAE